MSAPTAQHSAVVFAYHNVGVRCLQVLLARNVRVPLVVTHEDDPSETIWFDSVGTVCVKHGIPFITPTNPKSEDLLSKVQALQPDFIFSFYYRYMLPTNLLDQARCGAYNMHGSLLPKYRGRAPVNWAILHGETETGMTLHEMVAKPDAGAIVAQSKIPILPDETAFEVFGKLSTVAEQTLWNIFPDMLEGRIPKLHNDIARGSYFGRRKPEDGRIDWRRSAKDVYNLHRAVAPPYPGAWTVIDGHKLIIGKASLSQRIEPNASVGLLVRNDAILGICGDGQCIMIDELLDDNGQPVSPQALGALFQSPSPCHQQNGISEPTKTVFILGINGFVGHHLLERILQSTNWMVFGIDIEKHRIIGLLDNAEHKPRLLFREGHMETNWDWIEARVKESDAVLPLAAISTPLSFVKSPLRVFEVDFEANLRIVRLVAKHKKRLIFPSTSEVYGMCHDDEFDTEESQLICGPIHKSRWIYSCSKQLLDRVIFGYGAEGLDFTIFRPFNWVGPGLDSVDKTHPDGSRVTTRFLGNIIRSEDMILVDGGSQRRVFTYINDGIDALMKIIVNENNIASGKIYNIGNPANDYSIRDLATLMLDTAVTMEGFKDSIANVKLTDGNSTTFYGEGYQDVQHRVPKITNACEDLGWSPSVTMEDAIRKLFFDLTTPS
ncbi:unnamed protein product [Fusarium graminearum]|nr:unnamed protein product [Fusarium graminearum]